MKQLCKSKIWQNAHILACAKQSSRPAGFTTSNRSRTNKFLMRRNYQSTYGSGRTGEWNQNRMENPYNFQNKLTATQTPSLFKIKKFVIPLIQTG